MRHNGIIKRHTRFALRHIHPHDRPVRHHVPRPDRILREEAALIRCGDEEICQRLIIVRVLSHAPAVAVIRALKAADLILIVLCHCLVPARIGQLLLHLIADRLGVIRGQGRELDHVKAANLDLRTAHAAEMVAVVRFVIACNAVRPARVGVGKHVLACSVIILRAVN